MKINTQIIQNILKRNLSSQKSKKVLKPQLKVTKKNKIYQFGLNFHPKFYPPQYKSKNPIFIKNSDLAFVRKKKKRLSKFEYKLQKRQEFAFKKKLLQRKRRIIKLLHIFIKRNPYVLIRKNYQSLFKEFFKEKLITPLLLDYLHLAYFKLNINKLYRPRLISKLDSYAKRVYRYTLSHFKRVKVSNAQYIFVLMKKKTYFQKVLDFYNTKSLYTRQLHQLYFFQKVKKLEFKKFLIPPKYLHPETACVDFFKNDHIRYNEYLYIQQILEFYYPVTEIKFKETHIHGKPMKTKLPRRV